jgi:hypothetical protein
MQSNNANSKNTTKSPFGNTGITIAVAAVILALAGALVYFIVQNQKLSSSLSDKEKNEVELEKEIKDLDNKLRGMETELQSKDLQLEEKNKKIEEIKKQLEKAQANANSLAAQGKINQKKLDEMSSKINELTGLIKNYEQRIAQLEAQNRELRTENEGLRSGLQQKDSSLQVKTAENDAMKTTLQSASILKCGDFKFIAVKNNGKEDRDIEFRRGKLDHLKICFDVMENPAAIAGNKEVFIVIRNPSGKVYPGEGGRQTFTASGVDTEYSISTTFYYTKTRTPVCVIYNKPKKVDYEKGRNEVIVFSDGVEIGRGDFNVKAGLF